MNGMTLGLGLLAAAAAAPAPQAEDAKSQPVAIVAGVTIDEAQVDESIKGPLMELRSHEYQLRSRAVDALITQVLVAKEAAARGISADAFEKAEVYDKATVTEAEAKAYYEAHKSRLPAGTTEAQAIEQITNGLGQQRREERRAAVARELRAKYDVKVLLEPYRVPVDVGTAPVRGNPKAPVTVVEFSDFQCPYCIRARPTVARVRETYGDKVRWVFRHFPLSFHNLAEKAGEAAACAGAQGKFWEMHDRLWADSGKLQVPELKTAASAIGLDQPAFDKCLDSGRFADLIARDEEAGQGYGVSGTPAFFVNGRPLVGAQPFDAFQQVIDDELARSSADKGKAASK